MIQANCRTRFTASDFDFVVKTLGKSRRDAVTLSELLTDEEMRDSILDHELLVQAVLSNPGHLSISPQFYFYILTRHVLKETGCDRKLCDYLASLLEAFSRTARMRAPAGAEAPVSYDYISDLLIALRNASPVQAFLIRAHMGNYSLFISGIFHENLERRRQRGAPDMTFYEEMGSSSFKAASEHRVARTWDLSTTFEALSARFREVRLGLNRLSDQLINIGDDHGFQGLIA